MARPSRKGTVQVGGLVLPVHIYFENRRNSRVSLGKSAVLVRLPGHKLGTLLKEDMIWVKNWLEKTYRDKPEHFLRLSKYNEPHQDGQIIHLFDRDITLRMRLVPHSDTIQGRWKDGEICLTAPEYCPRQESSKIISKLISRKYRSHLTQKVHHWNNAYFRKEIKSVRLKYNSSNWGSCSTHSNINLSTRLLLTPEPVQDYVVVHELAHLIEMNHSNKFWKVVETVMPDYRRYEKWLKEKGTLMDF